MEKIKCELCGSNEIVKENDMFVCKHCGTKYTVQEAQKLIGKVEIDKSKEKENWLVLARRARLEGNNENASKYYGLISEQDPSNWEAAFYQKFYQASGCNLAGIPGAIGTITMAYITTFGLINKIESDNDKLAALKEISNSIMNFADNIGNVGVGYKQKNSDNQYAQQSANQWIFEATKLYLTATSFVESEKTSWLNTSDAKNYAVEVWKRYNKYLAKYGDVFKKEYRDSQMSEATRHISALDKNYVQPEKESTRPSGCYVATCVYGSYDCPQVWTLRRYRDMRLSKTVWGRLFIRCYYFISPKIIRIWGNKSLFRTICKKQLDKFVHKLNMMGYENTSYRD